MSKNKIIKTAGPRKVNLEKEVMAKISKDRITMKPKWYFVAGSMLMIVGLVGLSVAAVFLTNLTLFLLRKRGPGVGRLQIMLEAFPWWVPLLAIAGTVSGIWLLKKYDFSYKKNFLLILLAFVVSIGISAWFIESMGLNEIWSRRGPMKRFYQQLEKQENSLPKPRSGPFYHQSQ
jgi:hypothetical protein